MLPLVEQRSAREASTRVAEVALRKPPHEKVDDLLDGLVVLLHARERDGDCLAMCDLVSQLQDSSKRVPALTDDETEVPEPLVVYSLFWWGCGEERESAVLSTR